MKLLKTVGVIGILMSAGSAGAQEREYSVKSGGEVRVLVAWDCRGAPALTGTAANGSVSVRPGKRKGVCSGEANTLEAYYRPNPGFKGVDTVYLYRSSQPNSRRVTVY